MIRLDGRPELARHARLKFDRVFGEWLLLAPERGLRLNASAHAVLELVDGRRCLTDIVALLAARYDEAPRAELERDVVALVAELTRRGLLRLEPGR